MNITTGYNAELALQVGNKVTALARRETMLRRRNAIGDLTARELKEFAELPAKIKAANDRYQALTK